MSSIEAHQCPYHFPCVHTGGKYPGGHQCWRSYGHDGPHRADCGHRGGLLNPDAEVTWAVQP